ncbi:hypothetical protein [Actinomyces sp.]|uniref:hypothetical protein n=1 Tax=Actinomyces sp. TaxID=29317 RepID=UPI0026DD01B0|nr:hypothetical protein [Actinomyces sp.]MDO4901486.1 hypothetical protein [Actinomyces sp.]
MAAAYSNSTILLCILGLVSCFVLLDTEALRAAIWGGAALAAVTLTASLVTWTILYGLWPIEYVWWTRGWVVSFAFGVVPLRAIRDLTNNINDSICFRYAVHTQSDSSGLWAWRLVALPAWWVGCWWVLVVCTRGFRREAECPNSAQRPSTTAGAISETA